MTTVVFRADSVSKTTSIQTGLFIERSSSTASATATSQPQDAFIGNKPSTVLFFVALCIGVCIAAMFLFFTMRYFVRSRFGMYVPVSAYGFAGRSGPVFASGRNAFAFFAPGHDFHFDGIHDPSYTAFMMNNGRRYRKKYRLSKEQVDNLFPVKTYHDWVHGGQAEDEQHRKNNYDVVCEEQEEEEEDSQSSVPVESSSSSQPQAAPKEVDLAEPDKPVPEAHFTSGICAICIDTLEDDDQVRGLVCGHVYHAECIDPWLINRRASCPMCKRDYYIRDENEPQEQQDSDAVQNLYIPRTTQYRAQTLLAAVQALRQTEQPHETTEGVDLAELPHDETTPDVNALRPFNPADLVDLDVEARRRVEEKSKWFYYIFWKLMGIQEQDLFNHYVVDIYERRRYHRRAADRLQNNNDDNNDTSDANNERPADYDRMRNELSTTFVHSLA